MLLATSTTLRDGSRARVRLLHRSDRPGLRALHARLGIEMDELALSRVLRFDPRHRAVACVTVWHGGAQRLAGYGAIDLDGGDVHLLIADVTSAPGVDDVLLTALRDRAGRSRAAA